MKPLNRNTLVLLLAIFISIVPYITPAVVIAKETTLNLTPEEQAWLKKNPVIKVGSDPYWAPVEFIDSNGNRSGISADYLKEIEKLLNVKIEYTEGLLWSEIIEKAKTGEINLLTNISVTDERSTFLNFSNPYISFPILIYTRNDVSFIASISKLKNKKIAVVKDYAIKNWLAKDYPDLPLILCENTEEALLKLKNKEVFAYIGDIVTTGYYIRKEGYLSFKVAGKTKYAYNGCMGTNKNLPILASVIEKALAAIATHKKYAIYNKWITTHQKHPFDYSLLWKILFCVFVIIMFFIWSNIRLRNAVRKRTKELSENEAQYRTLFESSNDGIMIIQNGLIKRCNKKGLQLFGFEKESEIIDLTPNDLSPEFQPDGQNSYEKSVEKIEAAMAGKVNIFQWKSLNKQKQIFDSEVSLTKITIKGEDCLLTVVRDITQSKALEKKIESDQRFTEAIIDAIPGTFFVCSEYGRFIRWNKLHETKYGYTKEEIQKMTIKDWFREEEMPWIMNGIKECLTKGFSENEAHPLSKDGTMTPVFYKIRLLTIENARYIVGVGLDMTEKKKTEQELIKAKEKAEESDRLKTAFLAGLSHEIRTPMNGILGFSELLKNTDLTATEHDEYLQTIEQSGQRMLNIINDLIDISKIESGQISLYLSDTSINEMIDELYKFFKPQATQKNITLIRNKNLPDNKSILRIDRGKIIQVLTNLITNSLKFTESGSIEFGYTPKDNLLEFYVKDTGIGIDSAMQDVIFERFRQIDAGYSTKQEGSGLGLAISKAFIEEHNGQIWVSSEINQGSHFYFTLPY